VILCSPIPDNRAISAKISEISRKAAKIATLNENAMGKTLVDASAAVESFVSGDEELLKSWWVPVSADTGLNAPVLMKTGGPDAVRGCRGQECHRCCEYSAFLLGFSR
jgi:hypothetical protein